MKKIVIMAVAFFWHSCHVVESVSLPVLSQEVDDLMSELTSLLDYFDGHAVAPVAFITPASTFIKAHFDDDQLSGMAYKDLHDVLAMFVKTYTAKDPFYAEYEMWTGYVAARYWELQFLADKPGAAEAFSLAYLNTFTPLYRAVGATLSEPYKTQVASLALECALVYDAVRIKSQNAENLIYR